ncbi:hypothetical protein [Dyadobacter sandarakinus]|uniref:hypothetical protein n=1 Tax=Dyadobacter sandarakinus TaxID=2747268 RepID=UPI00195A680D|nr:hypothetical protein [Dyadobacter sandarakinus]
MEPIFGSLVHHYGLNKINVLGKAAAHKVMLMSAICINLKKYLKTFNNKLVQSAAKEAKRDCKATFFKPFYRFGLTS